MAKSWKKSTKQTRQRRLVASQRAIKMRTRSIVGSMSGSPAEMRAARIYENQVRRTLATVAKPEKWTKKAQQEEAKRMKAAGTYDREAFAGKVAAYEKAYGVQMTAYTRALGRFERNRSGLTTDKAMGHIQRSISAEQTLQNPITTRQKGIAALFYKATAREWQGAPTEDRNATIVEKLGADDLQTAVNIIERRTRSVVTDIIETPGRLKNPDVQDALRKWQGGEEMTSDELNLFAYTIAAQREWQSGLFGRDIVRRREIRYGIR